MGGFIESTKNTIDGFYKNSQIVKKKLHLGCGSTYLDGWCNVDFFPSSPSDTHRGSVSKVDVWEDIRSFECTDETVSEVLTVHTLEHLYRHEGIGLLARIYQALTPGGLLVIETPDLDRLVKLAAFLPIRVPQRLDGANRCLIRSQFYGAAWEINSLGYSYHKYVWSKRELAQECEDVGFKVELITNASRFHVPARDLAIVCSKPGESEFKDGLHEVLKLYGNRRERLIRQTRSVIAMEIRGIRFRRR